MPHADVAVSRLVAEGSVSAPWRLSAKKGPSHQGSWRLCGPRKGERGRHGNNRARVLLAWLFSCRHSRSTGALGWAGGNLNPQPWGAGWHGTATTVTYKTTGGRDVQHETIPG